MSCADEKTVHGNNILESGKEKVDKESEHNNNIMETEAWKQTNDESFTAVASNTNQRSAQTTLDQDRILAKIVSDYPSLYDRSDKGFSRINDPLNTSWREVAKKCEGISTGEEACRLFEVLKKRYSKKKMNYKRASHNSSSPEFVHKCQRDLEKYSFMKWLEPFIRFRSSKLVDGTRCYDEYINDEATEDDPAQAAQTETIIREHRGEQNENSQHKMGFHQVPASIGRYVLSKYAAADNQVTYERGNERLSSLSSLPTQVQMVDLRKRSITNIQEESTHPKISRMGCSDVVSQTQPSLVYETKVLKDDDDLFAAMIVSQLRKLDKREKCVAKHDISNILFKAQLKQIDQSE
ncbi:uncharacterized protein LOC130622475 [Hydractinia symbiolongicarpus]|uniref:uncharacterized protein LOC130622475 n=1 Tax=Hydractinia symbiolongicarpus TaxID=13093 RepID=UPI00255152E5|nr:uncharacterized protein LOC130622475 [Hydractinia symbiolongicarpus]